jgi:hypothetical protein
VHYTHPAGLLCLRVCCIISICACTPQPAAAVAGCHCASPLLLLCNLCPALDLIQQHIKLPVLPVNTDVTQLAFLCEPAQAAAYAYE